MDQHGQSIDVRLTARRDAKAASVFLRQAGERVRLYQSLTIVTDKAVTYATVIGEIHERLGPEDAIRHVTGKHLNNRIESDHAALMRLLRPMRGFWDCECWTFFPQNGWMNCPRFGETEGRAGIPA